MIWKRIEIRHWKIFCFVFNFLVYFYNTPNRWLFSIFLLCFFRSFFSFSLSHDPLINRNEIQYRQLSRLDGIWFDFSAFRRVNEIAWLIARRQRHACQSSSAINRDQSQICSKVQSAPLFRPQWLRSSDHPEGSHPFDLDIVRVFVGDKRVCNL